MASLADEDVSFAHLAELIEKDAVLAGNILRLVNSALFNLRRTVQSVRQAVPLLGIEKIRSLAMVMSVARMWKIKAPSEWSVERFNLHSVAVGMLSHLLAQKLDVPDKESAFAAGLFHDLGWLMAVVGLPEECAQMSKLQQQSQKWLDEYEMQVLGTTHAELAAEALAVWNLPESIRTAVRYHANPEQDPAALSAGQVTLSRVVHCADQHVRDLGILVKVFEDASEDECNPLAALKLDGRLPIILSEFENEFSAIRPYFLSAAN